MNYLQYIVYPSCRGSINSFITCIFDFAFQKKNMSQHLEIDSETYAELGVKEYYTRIKEWMDEKETENVEIYTYN